MVVTSSTELEVVAAGERRVLHPLWFDMTCKDCKAEFSAEFGGRF